LTPQYETRSNSVQVQSKLYSEDHEYLLPTGTPNTYKIGISTYAAKTLGDITYVELPAEGDMFSANEPIGAVESVKAAAEILAPVDLKIVSVNSALEDSATTVGLDPEGEGWIAEVEVEGDVKQLMNEEQYKEFTEKPKED
jgi:glycine cleavage system H protein